MNGRGCAPGPSAGFAGWLFPFQGRSLASALAGPAVLGAGLECPAQRYITGAIFIAIGLPFGKMIYFNHLVDSLLGRLFELTERKRLRISKNHNFSKSRSSESRTD